MVGLRELAMVAAVVLVLYGRTGVIRSRRFQTIWPWIAPVRRKPGRPGTGETPRREGLGPSSPPPGAATGVASKPGLFQLEGNRLEMSPRDLAAVGVVWAPPKGLRASAQASYVGERFLNKRNTALADSYTTYSAGVGYRFPSFEVRLDGTNLNDARDPVSESELGDAQYYRLPARTVSLMARWTR